MAVPWCFSTDSTSTSCPARYIAVASPIMLPPTTRTGTSMSTSCSALIVTSLCVPTLTIMGNAAGRVLHDSHRPAPGELAVADTHGTAHLSTNHLVIDSTGLGWR